MRTLPITSQKLHFLIPSCWVAGFQHMDLGGTEINRTQQMDRWTDGWILDSKSKNAGWPVHGRWSSLHDTFTECLVNVYAVETVALKACELSHVWLFEALWTVACQAPLSMTFSRQEYLSGLPFPSPGDLLHPGIKHASPALAGIFFTTELPGKPNIKGKLM